MIYAFGGSASIGIDFGKCLFPQFWIVGHDVEETAYFCSLLGRFLDAF